MITLAASNKCK